MKPIKVLFTLFSLISMLLLAQASYSINRESNLKKVGIELRTCHSADLVQNSTELINPSIHYLEKIPLIETGTSFQEPAEIDFGDLLKASNIYLIKPIKKQVNVGKYSILKKPIKRAYKLENITGLSCGGQGDN